jgi:hypothetical protein
MAVVAGLAWWIVFVVTSPPPKGRRYVASERDARPLQVLYESIQRFRQSESVWPSSIDELTNWSQSEGIELLDVDDTLQYYPNHVLLTGDLQDNEIIVASQLDRSNEDTTFVLYFDGVVAELQTPLAELLISAQKNRMRNGTARQDTGQVQPPD